MAAQKKEASPNIQGTDTATLETPGDDAQPQQKASHPTKGRRFRLLGKGEGDYCIYQIAPKEGQLPQGCLIPIPEVPRFENCAEANRWIKNDSGDLLAGKEVMVFQAVDILRVLVAQKPVVSIERKPKIQVSGPETESA